MKRLTKLPLEKKKLKIHSEKPGPLKGKVSQSFKPYNTINKYKCLVSNEKRNF